MANLSGTLFTQVTIILLIACRWRKSDKDVWSCTLHGRILNLRQDSEYLHYHAIFPSHDSAGLLTPPPSVHKSRPETTSEQDHGTLTLVKHYLNLKPNLTNLYEQWASADKNFEKKAPRFTGIRILKQDAWEALIGFICSSNNNIARISQMVEKLCINYGPLVGHIDGKAYYDFPKPAALTGPDVEQHLRELGFGYRAKYIRQTAVLVEEKGHEWLNGLRNPESPVLGAEPSPAGNLVEGGREGYRAAHEQLLALSGVGPKVADCVCLMGLGWGEAVPVDTHVWQIAQRDYKFGKGKHSSLTKATYDAIGNRFRALWGKEAGWAHSVLFTADLRAFSERLVAKVEVKEELDVIKNERSDAEDIDTISKTVVVEDKRIKREFEEEEHQVITVGETIAERSKRRRRR